MKEIVLDTETTGISIKEGHIIVEIGCIELDNLVPINKFHAYLNQKEKFQRKLLKYTVIPMNFFYNKKSLVKL